MLPFLGYNVGDYFAHWIDIGKNADESKMPKIFFVNWFRRGADGRFLWPGFGENSRVLKWVFERVNGDAAAVETPIGLLPTPEALDTDGLEIADEDLATLAEGIPDNTSALVLLFEHRWAVRVKEAIQAAGGVLIARSVIPPEILEEASAELEAYAAQVEAGVA
jgi:phosphoenolpyruvate carboxykinase (GTP)